MLTLIQKFKMQMSGNLNVELQMKNQDISYLKEELDRLKSMGEDAQKLIDIVEEDVLKAIKKSFDNVISQVYVLNLGDILRLDGLYWTKTVVDGMIVQSTLFSIEGN